MACRLAACRLAIYNALSKASMVLAVLGISCAVTTSQVFALPFNDDMVHDQYPTGEVMRAAPKSSIPIGAASRYVKDRSAAEQFTNPLRGDQNSSTRGKRLWDIHCASCHGVFTGSGFERASADEAWMMAGPDLSVGMYRDRTDGSIFATIHFGSLSTLMPRYGWKLSPGEHWDLVNYIRTFQRVARRTG